MTTPPPDQSESLVILLTQARSGDGKARDRLFQKCRNYVTIVARTQVEGWMQGKVDTSDMVQQTLLEAHRGFEHFEGQTEAEWLAWLRRILSNNVTDFARKYRQTAKRQASREVPLTTRGRNGEEHTRDVKDSAQITPSQLLLQKERELQVTEALAGLSEDHQRVIILRNLQRLSFEEVAERMGRTRPAVQMLWMRAIRKLRESMKYTHDSLFIDNV